MGWHLAFKPDAYHASAALMSALPDALFGDSFEGDPDLCPAGRAFETKVSHRYDMADARVLDVKRADNIFGTFARWNPQTPFVWDQGFTVFPAVKRPQYIASKLHVPATLPPDQHGKIYKGETVPGPRNTVSISTKCGDFDFVPQFCKGQSSGPGSTILAYKLPGYAGVGCTLKPDSDYYLNIKQTDPNEPNPFCGPVTCGFTLQNNHTP
jgi:hypothetical protein